MTVTPDKSITHSSVTDEVIQGVQLGVNVIQVPLERFAVQPLSQLLPL